jgi:hypothetical protein
MMDGHRRSVIVVTTSEPYPQAAARDGNSVASDAGDLVSFGDERCEGDEGEQKVIGDGRR